MVPVPKGITNAYDIALLEFNAKKIPLMIRRFLPNGQYEDWRLEDMISI
jgi:DNA-directed RNA polymerase I, II, and III subunit RPABC2